MWGAATALVMLSSAGAATDPATANADGVSGIVRSTRVEGSTVRLLFDDDPQSVQVVLILGWLNHFPPAPEQYYVGKSLTVRGAVQKFHEVSEIAVRDPADITVHGAPADAPQAADRESEIERLHDQVRTLQRRVQELEPHEPAP